jgi:BlaI family transcriptional regulator, penicillinase repressor
MARTPQDVTDTELAILQLLWDEGELTIRQLTDRLYPGGGTAHYATVQKLLERLERKGFVLRERRPAAHTFAAAVPREELIGRRLQAVAEELCGGSLTPLLTHLVRAKKLSARERQELHALIDQLSPPAKSKGQRP